MSFRAREGRATKAQWYVINTNPKAEALVGALLEREGWRAFLPTINKGRGKSAALFPGYLFVRLHLDEDSWGKINYLQGVRKLLSFGGRPVAVPAAVVEFLSSGLRRRDFVRDRLNLRRGDRVRFTKGHFAGLEGVFTGEKSGRERVKILLAAVYHPFVVEADAAVLSKIS